MDGLIDEADGINILRMKLCESCIKNEEDRKPRAAKPHGPILQPLADSAPVKVKQEPVSDDDTPSSHAVSSKPRPAGRSGTSAPTASTSTSAAKAATIPAPLVRCKNSKNKIAAPRQNATSRRVDKKGKRAARTPLDSEVIEISSDPESEDN